MFHILFYLLPENLFLIKRGGKEEYHLNNYGFKTHNFDFQKQKHDNEYVILCFEGSTTIGELCANEKTWPAKLEKMLNSKYIDFKITVYNLGQNAGTLPYSIVNFSLIGTHLNPDLLIVYHGINDLREGLGYANYKVDYSHSLRHLTLDSISGLQTALPVCFFKSAFITVTSHKIDELLHANDLYFNLMKKDVKRTIGPLSGLGLYLDTLENFSKLSKGFNADIIFSTFFFKKENMIYKAFNIELKNF